MDIFRKLDTILASVPIKDNRGYWKLWKNKSSKVRIETLDQLFYTRHVNTQIKAFKEIFLNTLNSPYTRDKLLELIRTLITGENGQKGSYDSIAKFIGIPNSSDYYQQTGKYKGRNNDSGPDPKYGVTWSEYVDDLYSDETKKKFLDMASAKMLEFFDKISSEDKNSPEEAEILLIFCAGTPGTGGYRGSWFFGEYSSLFNECLDKEPYYLPSSVLKNTNSVPMLHEPENRDISELYKDWFAEFGAKYRLVPKDLVFENADKAIKKFNYCIEICALIYMRITNRAEEAEAIEQWLNDNRVSHKVDIDRLAEIFNMAVDNTDWPETPINYYQEKMYQYRTNPKRKERIGKYITIIMEKTRVSTERKAAAKRLGEIFNDHNLEKETNPLCVVISRHEYDIVGQSTNRNWTSCQNIYDGVYREFVAEGIEGGILVAYLCRTDDTDVNMGNGKYAKAKNNPKINIQNPLGRVLIKPFLRSKDEMDFENPNWVLIVSKTYGIFHQYAIDALQKWLNENWNNRIVEKIGKGHYYPNDRLYKDTYRESSGLNIENGDIKYER